MRDFRSQDRTPGQRGATLIAVGAALLAPAVGVALAAPGDDFDEAPINYATTQATDPVARLQAQVERGEVLLTRDSTRGYLASVLRSLKIPVSSQVLVFSKTSFQRDGISPLSPRAIYFNDDTYVGWVKGGSMLEISSADPNLGAVFYTLPQEPGQKPKLARQSYECLSCHSSTLTKGVPGHTVRSVFAGRDGLPFLQAGTFVTTHESPLKERWGGWYVTGTHGEQQHMGNSTFKDAEQAQSADLTLGSNTTDLRRRFDTTPYLTKHSDIVALMVLEHQTYVQNLMTRASYETRRALHYEQALNRDLGRPAEHRSDSTISRIRSVGEPLVRALLFQGEAALTAPVAGTSGFSAEFPRQGPKDRQGRSLRDFDLKQRLFRYPCSYQVYSKPFDALPPLAKEYVYRRLWEILDGKDTSADFAYLSAADRKAILEILLETKPEFAAAKPAATPVVAPAPK